MFDLGLTSFQVKKRSSAFWGSEATWEQKMMAKNIRLRGLVVALAVATLFAVQPVAADTLKYDAVSFNSWDRRFSIHDGTPTTVNITTSAGAVDMTDTSTLGTSGWGGTTFMAWSVDIYHYLNTRSDGTAYTLKTDGQFYTSLNAYKETDLERLATYALPLVSDRIKSAAFQLAVLEIVNELPQNSYSLSSPGDFWVTSSLSAAPSLANTWLANVDDNAYWSSHQVTQSLGVWQQNCTNGCTQNLAVFTAIPTPVPEPETYAMMLAGLGLMGFIARRRTGRDAA